MRKIGIVAACAAMVVVLVFALVGCGGSGPSSSASEYVDQQFIADIGKALEARWAITDVSSSSSSSSDDEEREARGKAVDAELAVLGDYTSAKFEDSALQEKAIKYVNCLKDQKAALEYYSADYSKYREDWSKAYDARTQLLKDFVDNYGLTVSEKHADILKDLLTNAKLVTEKEDQQAAVDAICASMHFESAGDEFGHEYTAVVENTAGVDFEYFSINVNLLDADGVVIESTGDSVNNWEKGQKVKFSIYASEPFASTSVKASSWSAAK